MSFSSDTDFSMQAITRFQVDWFFYFFFSFFYSIFLAIRNMYGDVGSYQSNPMYRLWCPYTTILSSAQYQRRYNPLCLQEQSSKHTCTFIKDNLGNSQTLRSYEHVGIGIAWCVCEEQRWESSRAHTALKASHAMQGISRKLVSAMTIQSRF